MSIEPFLTSPMPHERCVFCGEPANQLHHHTYERACPHALAVVPTCAACHERIHLYWDRVRDEGISVGTITIKFWQSPERIDRWTRRRQAMSQGQVIPMTVARFAQAMRDEAA